MMAKRAARLGGFSMVALGVGLMAAGCSQIDASVPVSPYPEKVVGVWAASEAECADADSAWRFERDTVATNASASCAIEDIWTALRDTPVATYTLACQDGAETESAHWRVTLASADRLEIDRQDGGAPVALVRCQPGRNQGVQPRSVGVGSRSVGGSRPLQAESL